MVAGAIDQLRGHAQCPVAAADTAFDQHVGTQRIRHRLPVLVPVPEIERRLAADDAQFPELGELVQQFLDDAVGYVTGLGGRR